MDFKKLSEVTQVTEAADTANVLIEEDGVVKRVPKSEVGRGSRLTIEFNIITPDAQSAFVVYLNDEIVYQYEMDWVPSRDDDGCYMITIGDGINTVYDLALKNIDNLVYHFTDDANTDDYLSKPIVSVEKYGENSYEKAVHLTTYETNGNYGLYIFYGVS